MVFIWSCLSSQIMTRPVTFSTVLLHFIFSHVISDIIPWLYSRAPSRGSPPKKNSPPSLSRFVIRRCFKYALIQARPLLLLLISPAQ